jgi:hypothetical protein
VACEGCPAIHHSIDRILEGFFDFPCENSHKNENNRSMPISLPYCRGRYYLTGGDWIIGLLDCLAKRGTGAGNTSQIILEIKSLVDVPSLIDAVQSFACRFPVLSGQPARDWLNLAPFWRIGCNAGHCDVDILPAKSSLDSAIAALCHASNTPFASGRNHLVFRLVHVGSDQTVLGMVFDHRLFDARGAELFLALLADFAAGKAFPLSRDLTNPVREPYLSNWSEKFASGRNVNRALRACAAARPACLPSPKGRRRLQYQFQMLDDKQSSLLADAAFALGGYLVKMPYLLALAVREVNRIFAGRGQSPEHYLVPVSIDRRAAEAGSQSLFFNHISFLYFLLPRHAIDSMESLVKTISRQMYEQTKAGLPGDFEQTMHLMRILPVGVLASISQHLFGGNFGTFAFSFIGETAFRSPEFLGHRVENLFHVPRISTPPGLGIFLNEHAGRINVAVASIEGLLTAKEAVGLARCFLPTCP